MSNQRGHGRGGVAQKRSADHFGVSLPKKKILHENNYRFLVPDELVPAIIGKGGANIKSIIGKTHEIDPEAKISCLSLNSDGSPLMPGIKDRIVEIRGSKEALAVALENLIPNFQFDNQGRRVKLEVRFLVPEHSCPVVIGKKGLSIKKLQTELKSYAQVYSLPLPNSEECVVRMQNFLLEDLVATVMRVATAIDHNKTEKPISFYDPLCFQKGQYGDTGSFIDTQWYQAAIKAGQVVPTTYAELHGTTDESQMADQWGSGYDEYGQGYEEWGQSYDEWGQSYDEWGQCYDEWGQSYENYEGQGEWDGSYDMYGNFYNQGNGYYGQQDASYNQAGQTQMQTESSANQNNGQGETEEEFDYGADYKGPTTESAEQGTPLMEVETSYAYQSGYEDNSQQAFPGGAVRGMLRGRGGMLRGRGGPGGRGMPSNRGMQVGVTPGRGMPRGRGMARGGQMVRGGNAMRRPMGPPMRRPMRARGF